MLNSYFYSTFIRRCHPKLWHFKKHKNLHFSKSKKHKIQSKQQTGGTRNKHSNLLIYTVPFNRVLTELCYYNIQTIKYHNNAELIFLQHIFRRWQRTLWKLRKTQKFTFHNIQNNGTGEPEINTAIC